MGSQPSQEPMGCGAAQTTFPDDINQAQASFTGTTKCLDYQRRAGNILVFAGLRP
jgi:hypothetical protein